MMIVGENRANVHKNIHTWLLPHASSCPLTLLSEADPTVGDGDESHSTVTAIILIGLLAPVTRQDVPVNTGWMSVIPQ